MELGVFLLGREPPSGSAFLGTALSGVQTVFINRNVTS